MGWLKNAAFAIGSPAWLGYSLGFLVLTLDIGPGLYALSVWASQVWPRAPRGLAPGAFRRALAKNSLALLLLGLDAWITFMMSFAFPKISLFSLTKNLRFSFQYKGQRKFTRYSISKTA